MSKQQTRKRLREQRRRLTLRQQRLAGEAMARHLGRQLFFARARHIALYLPNDGEMDPRFLLELAVAAGKRTYLPVLDRHRPGHLCFMPWRPGDALIDNRFGIPEPPLRRQLQPLLWTLDIVCMPLVGFDRRGNRLGMGGGFYDRTFASRARHPGSRPLLVGLAHAFQQLEQLSADPWDVPLHAVATDTGVHFPRQFTPGNTP